MTTTRSNHFARLNAYRNSREYQAFAREFGMDAPTGEMPSLLGDRWEITEEIFDEFLNMLPPLRWDGLSFYVSEFSFSNITAKYSREGDRYYCEFARYPQRKPQPGMEP